MSKLRRANDRGTVNLGWLNSYHTFSFSRYYDPQHMGISILRVINEDTVAPGGGFSTHGHADMEIVSYVLDGALEHKDSLGNGSVIHPGDVQRMSAGSGVTHSEFNHSRTEPVRFLQIWLKPNATGVEPSYEQKYFPPDEGQGRWVLLVSPDGRNGSIAAHQDGLMYACRLAPDEAIAYQLDADRQGYLHLVRGQLRIGDFVLYEGDGLQLQKNEALTLEAIERAEILLFDLP